MDGVKKTGDAKIDERPVVPQGMEEAYADLKEVARTAKRNEGMDPTWWINMCKWAWDESVPD